MTSSLLMTPMLLMAEPSRPEAFAALVNLLLGALGGLILVGGAAGLYLLWYLRGRDRHAGLVAEYLREPPSDLHPGVVGTLLDEHANAHDVVATLTNLGRRGVLRIAPAADKRDDFTIELLRRDLPLSPVERLLLDTLFPGSRRRVRLGAVRARFVAAIPRFKEALYDEVIAHGYFVASPRRTRRRYRRAGLSLAVTAAILGLPAGLLLPGFRLLLVPTAALVVVGVALYRLARAMPVKTAKGVEEAARWRAFRRYLADIERYDDLAAARERFDRYLPYATALGLEQDWIKKFAAVDAAAPSWFGGVGNGFGDGLTLDSGALDLVGSAVSALPSPGGFGGAGQALSALPSLADVGQFVSDAGGAGLEAASDGLAALLDCAASVFDW